jgi:RNA polymerase sigma-70 factor (ECF subfamily)
MEGVVAIDTERVWNDLHANIHGFVSRRVRRAADVDDIVQRVFLQVHRSLPTLREADRLHAWIYRTTRRAIADYYRAPALRREAPAGAATDFVSDEAPSVEDALEDEPAALRELAGCLQPLLADLSEIDRQALHLVDIEGLTQTQAAQRLNLSVSGMKSRVQRARARLRTGVEACCQVELDRRGGPIAFQPRSDDSCRGCR